MSVGELAREARALNAGFFSRFERARPLIRLKLAMSLDARTAPREGGRMWISGEASRADVQALARPQLRDPDRRRHGARG